MRDGRRDRRRAGRSGVVRVLGGAAARWRLHDLDRDGRLRLRRRNLEERRVPGRNRDGDRVAAELQWNRGRRVVDAHRPASVDPPHRPQRERVGAAELREGRVERARRVHPLQVVAVGAEARAPAPDDAACGVMDGVVDEAAQAVPAVIGPARKRAPAHLAQLDRAAIAGPRGVDLEAAAGGADVDADVEIDRAARVAVERHARRGADELDPAGRRRGRRGRRDGQADGRHGQG